MIISWLDIGIRGGRKEGRWGGPGPWFLHIPWTTKKNTADAAKLCTLSPAANKKKERKKTFGFNITSEALFHQKRFPSEGVSHQKRFRARSLRLFCDEMMKRVRKSRWHLWLWWWKSEMTEQKATRHNGSPVSNGLETWGLCRCDISLFVLPYPVFNRFAGLFVCSFRVCFKGSTWKGAQFSVVFKRTHGNKRSEGSGR